jgi:hypothetical protein
MVTGPATAGQAIGRRERHNTPVFPHLHVNAMSLFVHLWGTVETMVGMALRPISHLTAWIVWHAARVSLLEDLDIPRPPQSV